MEDINYNNSESEDFREDTCYLFMSGIFLLFICQYCGKKCNNNKELKLKSIDSSTLLNKECSICLESFDTKNTIVLNCNHYFHRECINEWLLINNSCPICRDVL